MRTFAFAALAAIATAQAVVTKGEATALPDNVFGGLTSSATRFETHITDETTMEESVYFSIIWTNLIEGGHFEKGIFIQNYAQW